MPSDPPTGHEGASRPGGQGAEPPRGQRSGGSVAVVALRMEEVTFWAIQRAEKFRKRQRFGVGEKWVETCLEVQTSLVEATYVRDKHGLLAGASRGLVRARVLGRMAQRLGLLSGEQIDGRSRHRARVGGVGFGKAVRASSGSARVELPWANETSATRFQPIARRSATWRGLV